jgi:uncharacterized FlaG/YvyC family protein
MNIESQSATLMQVAHQATRAPRADASTQPAVRVPAPVPGPETAQKQSSDASDNRRRLAIAEKLVGANKSLIIEKDSHRVGFVYKTVDKNTGEVVRVWPQREVASALLALADPDARAAMAGMMVDAKA